MLGKAELDQLLSERERLNEELQTIIDESTEPWGVKVTAVEIKDVEIPEQMQRAMARQAEAERERRAKIINSEGEYQAAQKLTDAADIISTNPASLQLRYLQTLLEIGSNQNTTVVFPLPMDLLEAVSTASAARAELNADRRTPSADAGRRGAAAADLTAEDLPPPALRRASPERARDTHRPADRAEDDPRARPGRAAGGVPGVAQRGEGARGLPVLRGQRGEDPARGLRGAAGGRRARHSRLDDPRRPQPLPGARGGRGAGGAAGTSAEAGAFSEGGDPLLASRRAGEADLFASRPARGAHEVIVNAPKHVTAMAELDEEQFAAAVATWRERMRAHRESHYLQLVVNEGAGAGASLPHTHAQLYGLPFVPLAVARERERFGAYRERTGGSGLLSDVLVAEVRKQERLVAIDDEAALICPWASRSPFELRLVPRVESARFEDDTAGAAMLHRALRALSEMFGAPPEMNMWVRTAPRGAEHFHWHIDIVPRLTVRASFELATGVDINIYPPERAATDLRAALGE